MQELLFEAPLARLAVYADHIETAILGATASAQSALLKLSVVLRRAPQWLQSRLDDATAADEMQLLQKVSRISRVKLVVADVSHNRC